MTTTAHSFFDESSIYDEIVARNYMHHDDLFVHVRQMLKDRFGKRPCSILDLGCGSAKHLAASLRELTVNLYVGYDLSTTALDHARQNLAVINGEVALQCGDLLAGLQAAASGFDLIFSSFALHHLPSEIKAGFFRISFDKLAAGGLLLVIDTFLDDEQPRKDYLERYCNWLCSRCQTLPTPALDKISEHIKAFDYPETAAAFQSMSQATGFMSGFEVARYGWHRILYFDR